jgi:hypothetical protein
MTSPAQSLAMMAAKNGEAAEKQNSDVLKQQLVISCKNSQQKG